MIVNFQVTDKIIDESEGGCATKCVVANMVMEVLATNYSVGVRSNKVSIYKDTFSQGGGLVHSNRSHVASINNPPEVEKFIIHFDAYKSLDQWCMVPVYGKVYDNIAERGRKQGPGRPPCISFQLNLAEHHLKPEVVTAIKESGYNEAVRIVESCESVAALPLELAHAQ